MPDGSTATATLEPWQQNWSTSGGDQPPQGATQPWQQDWSTPDQAQQPQQAVQPWQQNWTTPQAAPQPPTAQSSQPEETPVLDPTTGAPIGGGAPQIGTGVTSDTPVPAGVQSFGAGVGQGAVTGVGSAIAGVGTALQASVPIMRAHQLDLMDRIDRGEQVPKEQDTFDYQNATAEQRAQIRQLVTQTPAGQSLTEQAGQAISAPGEWINTQGQKITPPEGYENSITNLTGKALGSIAVILPAMWAGGIPGAAFTAGSQTFHDAYTEDIKNGVAPEDAAANAGLKALVAGSAMAAPVASWAESLSGLAKRAFVAVATRAAADGLVLTTVSQAQQLTNNVIDRATVAPEKSLTEGVGDPKEMLAQFLAGTIPGVGGKVAEKLTGLPGREPAAGPAERPGSAGAAAEEVAPGTQPGQPEGRPGQPGAEIRPAPGAEGGVSQAPQPATEKVASGVSLSDQAAQTGQTLVRATDSNGTSWVGHGGVLVAEGRNQDVDAHFRDAEQNQPTSQADTQAIDDLVTSAHTNATSGITWTDRTTTPDGHEVVQGHDIEGHAVEIPEERYAVLAQYGDPSRDMFLEAHPGSEPVVAVRDPSNQAVVALAQGRSPLGEEAAPGAPVTLEDQDTALAARVPRTQRIPGLDPSNITDRPSLYRQAFRDAGYDPNVMVQRPVGDQIKVLSDHIQNTFGFPVHVDPKMQPQKAIDSLLDGYRNMQWMAHALGYPLPAMSLDGKVQLRLEPFKSVRPYLGLYSYDPATGTHAIHMPDRSNSFAHEWTHALDHDLVGKLAVNPTARGWLASARARTGGLDVTASNSNEAFANVMRAMFHDQADEALRIADLNAKALGKGPAAKAAAAEAQRLVAGAQARQKPGVQPTEFERQARPSSYLRAPFEMLARAHEAYVAHQVEQMGGGNEFITKGDQRYLDSAKHSFENLYPQGEERDRIFRAFTELHAQLLRENVLGHGPGAGRPGDYDMLDPIHWGNVAPPGANPAVTAGLRAAATRTTNGWKQKLEDVKASVAERAGAPGQEISLRPTKHGLLSAKDMLTAYVYPNASQLDVYQERYARQGNKAAAQVIRNATDRLGWQATGKNRLQQVPFERLERRLTNEPTNKYDEIKNRNGMPTNKVNLEQERQEFDALRGRDDQGKTPNVPDNITRAAAETRALLTQRWYEMERAGIASGFVRDEGYVPIRMDDSKILADGADAKPKIKDAMAADFDAKQQSSNGTFIHEAKADLPDANVPKQVRDDLADLARVQDALRAEAAKTNPDANLLAQLDAQHKALLARTEPTIRDLWSDQRADHMMHAVDPEVPWLNHPQSGSIGAKPIATPTRSRVLSPEARDKLHEAGYLVARPSELIPHYFHVTGRMIAFARTFGPNGEVLTKTMQDLAKAGVRPEDLKEIRAAMQSSLGMLRSNEITQGHRVSVWARALATMALMGRATYSTTHETMLTQLRTGSAKASGQAFSTAVQALMKEINLSKGSDRVRHLSDIAKFHGITTTRLQEAMLQGRQQGMAWSPGRVMGAYFRRIGMTQITNANKIGAIQGGHTFMQLLGRQLLDGKTSGMFNPKGELRELGIPDAEQKQFASWVTKLDGAPSLSDIQSTRMGQLWIEAVHRFVNKVVLEPTAAEKPRSANSALGRYVYSLMSYNFDFTRNVMNPAFARREAAVHAEQERLGSKLAGSASGNMKWAMYAASAVGLMMAAQLPTTILRQEVFDRQRADQWRADGTYWEKIIGLAFQRLGFGGVLDPVINTATGLKYDHDVSSLAFGGAGNFWAQPLMDITNWAFGGGSPDTNTAAYRAVRGAYQMLAMPVMALATALLPGGPKASWVLSALGQYGTSMSAADQFATMLMGPKGESTVPLTPQQRAAKQMKGPQYQRPLTMAEKQAKAQKEGGQAETPPAGLIGLIDDFAVPVSRALANSPIARILARYVH